MRKHDFTYFFGEGVRNMFRRQNRIIAVPASLVQQRMQGDAYQRLDRITFRMPKIDAMPAFTKELRGILKANHRLEEPSQGTIVPGNRFEYLEAVAALDGLDPEHAYDVGVVLTTDGGVPALLYRRSGGEIVVRELSAEQYVDILVSGGRPLINVDTLPAPAQELSGSECKILPLN